MSTRSADKGVRAVLGLTLVAALAAPAWAQKTFRCGSVYQDRPCAAAQPDAKVVNTTGAGQAVGDSRVDAECARRGNAAQRMAWARESGKTEPEQASGLGSEQRNLLAEVYRRRGSSLEVRKSIEADCMADKERAAAAPAAPAAPATKSESRSANATPPAPAPAGSKPGV